VSQSPENGSRHCKSKFKEGKWTGSYSSRNPLKTGLVTARLSAEHQSVRWQLSMSQSPENGSRHCKGKGPPALAPGAGRLPSQSPENGSRHCKHQRPQHWSEGLNPITSQSPENGSRHCKPRRSRTPGIRRRSLAGRNPLKTGLVTARIGALVGYLISRPGPGRNPLKTGLVTASLERNGSKQDPNRDGRNPLKTGLVTASPDRRPSGRRSGRPVSQSPENGSRHCKDHLIYEVLERRKLNVAIP